jgi:hypothetical protein
MSYEGHVQAICINGHYNEYDCYEYDKICHACGTQEFPRENGVDDTNCESYGEIPMAILDTRHKIQDRTQETCAHCNHTKQTSPDLYRIPDYNETRTLQHYRPNYGDSPLVPIEADERCGEEPDSVP